MKPKKRPKALRWKERGDIPVKVALFEAYANGRCVIDIGSGDEWDGWARVETKSQCEKLIKWLEKAKEHLR